MNNKIQYACITSMAQVMVSCSLLYASMEDAEFNTSFYGRGLLDGREYMEEGPFSQDTQNVYAQEHIAPAHAPDEAPNAEFNASFYGRGLLDGREYMEEGPSSQDTQNVYAQEHVAPVPAPALSEAPNAEFNASFYDRGLLDGREYMEEGPSSQDAQNVYAQEHVATAPAPAPVPALSEAPNAEFNASFYGNGLLDGRDYMEEGPSSQDAQNIYAQEHGVACSCDALCSETACYSTPCYYMPCCGNWRFSVRIGGFYSSNHIFRKAFRRPGILYGVQAYGTFCGCFTGFINADYYHGSGRPCCVIKRSAIDFYTGSIGICWPIKVCSFIEPYVGIGAVLGGVRLRDRLTENTCLISDHSSNCLKKNHQTSKTAFGCVVKSGIIIPLGSCLCACWFGEVFCDYMYLPIHFEKRTNIGGFKIGGGLGIAF